MTLPDRLSQAAPTVLSLVRIVVALLFLEHGSAKLLGFPPGGNAPAAFSLSWIAGVLELVGGALLTVGLFTRATAFILSGEMAFAYFLGHAPHGIFPLLNRGEGAILYCFIFFYFVFAGGGAFSLDAALGKGRPQRGANR